MKHLLFLFSITIITGTYAQEMGISKKTFSTENFRLAAAIGYDLSWAGSEGTTNLMSSSGTIEDDQIYYHSPASQTITLELDAYSPTSILGLLGGLNINRQKYTVKGQSSTIQDSIATTNIEIPLYVKARFGNALSRSQFWLALGAGYSFTTKAETIVQSGFSQTTIDSKNQFASLPFLSGILGYEFLLGSEKENDKYNRDMFRILLFAKANYDLGNRIDSTQTIAGTAINTYQDPGIEYLRISVGFKILLRLSKAGQLIHETIINQKFK